MNPCHEPLVAQISICSNTSGLIEYVCIFIITYCIIFNYTLHLPHLGNFSAFRKRNLSQETFYPLQRFSPDMAIEREPRRK